MAKKISITIFQYLMDCIDIFDNEIPPSDNIHERYRAYQNLYEFKERCKKVTPLGADRPDGYDEYSYMWYLYNVSQEIIAKHPDIACGYLAEMLQFNHTKDGNIEKRILLNSIRVLEESLHEAVLRP